VLEPEASILSVPVLKGARILYKLAGGPTSDSWLLSRDGSKAVMRIDKPLARILGLNRVAELAVLEQVADAGFGPAVIWADPGHGMLVTEYISGSHWTITDARRLENIERLAVRLRELHNTSIEGPTLDIAEAAERYASVAGTEQASKLHKRVMATLQLLGNESADWSLCHNDLGHQNIVDTGNIMFVDWEYAARGYPLFDLAGIARQNRFSQEQADQLQYFYIGSSAGKVGSRLPQYRRLYDLLSALWCQAVRAADGGSAAAMQD
jgi:thiamine kinase-like enzyme